MSSLSIINGAVFDGVPPPWPTGRCTSWTAHRRRRRTGPARRPGLRRTRRQGAARLIDAHCHAYGIDLDMLATESRALSSVALAAARRLGRALSRGFTTARDPAGGDAGLARAIAQGLIPAPRYLWTGAALSQTGGHGDARAADSMVCGCNAHTV